LVFLLLLSVVSVSLVRLRLVDRAFLYADSGISQESIESLNQQSSFWSDYTNLLNSLFSQSGGKTESGESIYIHIYERIIPSLELAVFAILIGTIFSIILGMESVYFPRLQSTLDSFSRLVLSTPIFIFAIFLLIVFFYKLELFPPGGYKRGDWTYLVLPGVSLGIRVYARLQLFISQTAKEEMASPFFLLLKTRGLPKRTLLYKNLFLKLFPTLLVLIVLDLGSLLSGAMVVEEIFFFPGIGRSLYYAIRSMDKELLQSLLIYSGLVFYMMNRMALGYQNRILNSEAS
jgi:peptide/nickel transport system permease protein